MPWSSNRSLSSTSLFRLHVVCWKWRVRLQRLFYLILPASQIAPYSPYSAQPLTRAPKQLWSKWVHYVGNNFPLCFERPFLELYFYTCCAVSLDAWTKLRLNRWNFTFVVFSPWAIDLPNQQSIGVISKWLLVIERFYWLSSSRMCSSFWRTLTSEEETCC